MRSEVERGMSQNRQAHRFVLNLVSSSKIHTSGIPTDVSFLLISSALTLSFIINLKTIHARTHARPHITLTKLTRPLGTHSHTHRRPHAPTHVRRSLLSFRYTSSTFGLLALFVLVSPLLGS